MLHTWIPNFAFLMVTQKNRLHVFIVFRTFHVLKTLENNINRLVKQSRESGNLPKHELHKLPSKYTSEYTSNL